MSVIFIATILAIILLYLIYGLDTECFEQHYSKNSNNSKNSKNSENSSPHQEGGNWGDLNFNSQSAGIDATDVSYNLATFESYKWNNADYPSLCLTRNPYGFPSQESGHLSWSSRKPELPPIATDTDKVSDTPQDCLGLQKSVPDEYYQNPEKFCRFHPNCYPCTNFWLKHDQTFQSKIIPMGTSVVMPKQKCVSKLDCPSLDVSTLKSI